MIFFRHIGQAIAAALAFFAIGALANENSMPKRVVSMNLCTDQLAMLLAGPGQLRSVSYLASDPSASAMAEEARGYHANRGLAEEVFLMRPDLVIAGTFTTRATVDMLKRLDIPVVEFAPANSMDDVRARVREMGIALGRQTDAERLVARFDADLAAARAEGTSRPRTALYYANSYTLGAGMLAHSVLEAAGLSNLAVELGYEGGGRLPLETLVMEVPDLIVTGRDLKGASLASDSLAHPALAALRANAAAAPVADRDWVCGTPFIVEAIRRLATARDAVLAER
ncbi:MAG: ABC transporter substrate-binding protein [Pseudomonadota bacterium]